MGHDIASCELDINIALSVSGIGFTLGYIGGGIYVAQCITPITAPQTITITPVGTHGISGSVYWNGIQRDNPDGFGPWIIHC